ncbi:outer membrane beta-barrel protein [Polaribacter glomeratus]|uniref:Outer membrane protein beta-barrel domain-containing protein n=1 Tax=Polaribacter glomeratus TaxID=102 RepID=A0A2S7WG37_9FLAO|nr:outer membrane beta-barrel protein [Polaribacter glomeratus]PQJ76564.1 hypothetical protein BTO16_11735 [Polaribacter glomeratus]TXD67602.1 porin family protein [Polaribacter glomeratus]
MKKQILVILITISSTFCYTQITFDKGYFINNADKKIECYIKNLDWKNNPTSFEYRLSENSDKKGLTIKEVKEFGVYNYSKYIRQTVNIDRSSENINVLSSERNPVFEEEELFLEVLVEGKSMLYTYENGSLIRFFYKEENTEIKQLIFKSYKTDKLEIKTNNEFRQQLLLDLKCKSITINDIKILEYTQKELVDFFVLKNKCNNSDVINFDEKQKKDFFNFTLRPGLNFSSITNPDLISSSIDADYGNKLNLRAGLEFEFIMGFHKNKWAVIVEPTFQYYNSEKESSTIKSNIKYTSIEIPVGIRHYFFLNENSKIFINGSYVYDINGNSTLSYNDKKEYKVTSEQNNFAFGLGYKLRNKFSLELRYQTTRDLYNEFFVLDLEYNTTSFIFGYTIF